MRPSTLFPRSKYRTGVAGPSLTPAGQQTRGEREDQIADLSIRMLTIYRNRRDIAQAVAAQDQILDGYRRGCSQIVENITSLDTYARAFDARITELDILIHGEMSTGARPVEGAEKDPQRNARWSRRP